MTESDTLNCVFFLYSIIGEGHDYLFRSDIRS